MGEASLIKKGLIPLDKSWVIRMGILDLVNGSRQISDFLASQSDLGDDLLALQRAVSTWNSGEPIDVGESGTLYRLLKFASWKLGLNKKFIMRGTLPHRKITNDPEIINWPQSELLKLDNATSQWATAAVLLGDPERLTDVPYKLKLTYEAVEHWNNNKPWQPKYDETILNQAFAFIGMKNGEEVQFAPEQAEDFCFAYTFGMVTAEEGEKRWPSLRGHESDRIVEMQTQLKNAQEGRIVNSNDHRVVQALAMWGLLNNKKISFKNEKAVNKSWPQFWRFLTETRSREIQ